MNVINNVTRFEKVLCQMSIPNYRKAYGEFFFEDRYGLELKSNREIFAVFQYRLREQLA